MRDRMTPEEFSRWIAFRQIYPDKIERLIYICKCGFTLLANAWGAKIEPHDLDPIPRDDREAAASPEQAAAAAVMMLGKPNGNCNR